MNDESLATAGADLAHASTSESQPITARDIEGTARFSFIPRHFGREYLMRAESLIYGTARNLCEDYEGDLWRFVELSNGGFFMAPSSVPDSRKSPSNAPADTMRLSVHGNYFDDHVQAETAGIIITLFVLCHLAGPDDEHFAEKYHLLLDYASTRTDYPVVRRAID